MHACERIDRLVALDGDCNDSGTFLHGVAPNHERKWRESGFECADVHMVTYESRLAPLVSTADRIISGVDRRTVSRKGVGLCGATIVSQWSEGSITADKVMAFV